MLILKQAPMSGCKNISALGWSLAPCTGRTSCPCTSVPSPFPVETGSTKKCKVVEKLAGTVTGIQSHDSFPVEPAGWALGSKSESVWREVLQWQNTAGQVPAAAEAGQTGGDGGICIRDMDISYHVLGISRVSLYRHVWKPLGSLVWHMTKINAEFYQKLK